MNWLFIAFALITQEIVSLNAVIYEVHRHHFHVWLFHILFALATIVDMLIGYAVGRYSRKKVTRGRVAAFADKWSARFHSYVGVRGRKVALFLLGGFSFPYVNAFIAAWLGMPFAESMLFLFIGGMTWYIATWLFVIGVATAIPNPWVALGAIVAVTVLLAALFRRYRVRKL